MWPLSKAARLPVVHLHDGIWRSPLYPALLWTNTEGELQLMPTTGWYFVFVCNTVKWCNLLSVNIPCRTVLYLNLIVGEADDRRSAEGGKSEESRHMRWTCLYSRVVLDLFSLYLFFVYIDVSFLFFFPPPFPVVSRCSQRLINVPIHSLCVCKWGPLWASACPVLSVSLQCVAQVCFRVDSATWILPLVPRELGKNNHVLLWEYRENLLLSKFVFIQCVLFSK